MPRERENSDKRGKAGCVVKLETYGISSLLDNKLSMFSNSVYF